MNKMFSRSAHSPVPARYTRLAGLVLAAISCSLHARAQGVLTVTPGRTLAATAGTGAVGYTGDGAAATSATLAGPGAVAYDAAGNLYVADTRNHAVRKVTGTTITTIAGTGIEGFSGDGGAATSAQLDTPTGVAVDASGNVYIADSKNNRIRKVTGTTITTVAGTGTAGFAGDGAAATSAQLALPSGVAVDSAGNVYIADTNNERIRKITGTIMTTLIGSGTQGPGNDAAVAPAAAVLDSPSGVAVDANGNVYMADRHNQRVRVLTIATGNVTTLAGSGTASFAGGFSGDGGTATAAQLSKPTGVSVDAAGNIYIADTNNQVIRQVSGANIATIVGSRTQGTSGDGGVATAGALNEPRGVVVDASGNLAVADKGNQRVRSGLLATLTFAGQTVGTTSTGSALTLADTGTGSITVAAITYNGAFVTSGGTCSAVPITIAAGGSCTLLVSYTPTAIGPQTGSVTFSGGNVVNVTTLLAGTGIAVTPTKLVFTGNTPPATVTAGISPGAVTVALEDGSGNIATTDSSTSVALVVSGPGSFTQTVSVVNGTATFTPPAFTAAGSYTYQASSGGLASAVATETVTPAAFSALSVSGLSTFTAPRMSGTATVKATDQYGNTVTSFTGTVTLSSTDATATFTPASYTFTSSDAGVHALAVMFNTAGTYSVTATSGAISGSETGILVEDAIWILNSNDTLARLTDAGVQTATAGTAGSGSSRGAVAFDNAGNVWATNSDSSVVLKFTAAGVAVPITATQANSGLSAPSALYVDGAGQVWVANAGNNSVSVLSNAGAAITPSTGYQPGALAAPTGIVVDSSGSVWITNSTGNSVTKVFGAAAPVVTPLVTGTINKTLGARP